MAWLNYTTKTIDTTDDLINCGTNEFGLIIDGQKTTIGAPDTTANKFIAGALIINENSGLTYSNTGTSALPVWTVLGGGGGIVIPLNEVVYGTGAGVTSSPRVQYDPASRIFSVQGQFATNVFLVDNNSHLYVLGDMSAAHSGMQVYVDDATLTKTITIGDRLNAGNSTTIILDDVAQSIIAQATTAGAGGVLSIDQTHSAVAYTNAGGAATWGFEADNTGGGQTRVIANNNVWTWPNADGPGSAALTTDGAGGLSWVNFLPYTLPNTQILVGNAGNSATPVNMSGEATIANTGAVTLADSVKVYTTKVSITSPQILALFVTPITLVPAPGAGKVIELIKVMGRINFNTTPYATNVDLFVIDAATSNTQFIDGVGGLGALLPSGSTFVGNLQPLSATNAQLVTPNSAVQIFTPAGNPTGGDGTLDIYTTYKIITL